MFEKNIDVCLRRTMVGIRYRKEIHSLYTRCIGILNEIGSIEIVNLIYYKLLHNIEDAKISEVGQFLVNVFFFAFFSALFSVVTQIFISPNTVYKNLILNLHLTGIF